MFPLQQGSRPFHETPHKDLFQLLVIELFPVEDHSIF